MKIAFLGAGNMGNALIQGAVKSKVAKPSQISVFDINPAIIKGLRKSGVKIAKTAAESVKGADFIFLCVKPQQMTELLNGIRDSVSKKQCLVSIAAGITTEKIEKIFDGNKISVVRVMPNTPAMVGLGASAVCGGKHARPAQVKFVLKFFSGVGKTVLSAEKDFDAVTAVSGSGPAYVFYLAESFAKAAESEGLDKKAADILIRQTILGAAKMLESQVEPSELRRRVTSPGGTTEAALRHMQENEWQEIFVGAVQKASQRSKELRQI